MVCVFRTTICIIYFRIFVVEKSLNICGNINIVGNALSKIK